MPNSFGVFARSSYKTPIYLGIRYLCIQQYFLDAVNVTKNTYYVHRVTCGDTKNKRKFKVSGGSAAAL